MFENLSKKLEKAFKVLKGKGSITEINVAQSMKEIRRALIQADVDYNTAKEFTNKVRDEALGRKVLDAVEPGQLLVKIVRDELAALMGSSASEISINNSFNVILIAGLQGSGKTTFSAKLANYLKKNKGKNPLLVACDVYRPAAIDQIKVLGEKIDVEVFSIESKNPIEIASKALKHAKSNNNNIVIIDTAGRLAVDEVMMTEVFNLKKECSPDEILFVVDSMTGQDAVNTAKSFNEKLNFDGVVLTKLDGDTRGGAALTIRSVVDKPIKFIGTSEKMDTYSRQAFDVLASGRLATAMDLSQEDESTRNLYGIDAANPPKRGGGKMLDQFLLARRVIEAGARCVTLVFTRYPYGRMLKGDYNWDWHKENFMEARETLPLLDIGVSALITDLKQRGLLDDTLVVWGGEFGRLPIAQLPADKNEKNAGRDHNKNAMVSFMAGGGIKGGISYGATDELGFAAVEDRVGVPDWHATILHLLGMHHEELFFERNGLKERLTSVNPARVVHEILA